MKQQKNTEIPFGAFDSELHECEYTIPEGYEAEIKDGKVIVRKAESEDDRIRKSIIHALHGDVLSMEETNQALAWLEKQKYTSYDQGYKEGIEQGKVWERAKYELEKQGEQKPVISSHDDEIMIRQLTEYFTTGNGLQNTNETIIEWLKDVKDRIIPQSKQEWSKEDERMYQSALWHVKNSCGNQGKTSGEYEVYNWLKSLRPQPQKEWSKEDEERIKKNIIEYIASSDIDKMAKDSWLSWLKYSNLHKGCVNFRNGRCNAGGVPQKQWKPSEEMLEALYRAVPENVIEKSEDEILLDKLYQGLKYGKVLSK